MQITVEDIISSGDRTAVRFCGEGTHTGHHLGIKATNRKVTFTGMTFTLWRDGKIAEGWNNVDIAGMMAQIGAE
jgi:predicted ester cyclase